jgi:arylsulfatase A-like enzyme
MKRRDLFKATLGGGLYAGILPGFDPMEAETPAKRPNFVFICADDIGWGDLGVYGHPEIQTPNLDRLASQGTLLTQFYCTSPVCSPSRVGYLTGQFPTKTGVLRPLGSHAQSQEMNIPDFLDPATPTTMRQLKQAGYATGHFGKWHLTAFDAPGGPPLPPSYGVDEYRIDLSERTVGSEHYQYPHPLPQLDHVTADDGFIFDAGIAFIEQHRDRPFYVNVWSHIPHIPLYPTAEQMTPYKYLRPNDPWPVPKQIYYAAVTVLDHNIGRLVTRLDELGLADSTVVVFTSDHGPENVQLNEDGTSGMGSTGPFRGHKVSVYEGGIRVPFVIRWSGKIPAGRVENDSVVSGVDLLPTFSKFAGADVPPLVQHGLDGEDVGGILLGASRPRRSPLYWENRFYYYGGTNDSVLHRSPILAAREGRWKLLVNPDGTRKELYDIPNDPSELTNRMDQHPDIGERLTRQVLHWYASMPGDVHTRYTLGDHTRPGLPQPTPGGNDYPWPTGASVAAVNLRNSRS